MPNLPPGLTINCTLAPLVKDGRHCLACRDVTGMEWVILESVEFYYGGSPWQRITRESSDIFALVESDLFKWPALERITGARFRFRLKDDRPAKRMTVRPSMRALERRDGAALIMEEWLTKRGFMEIAKSEQKSVA